MGVGTLGRSSLFIDYRKKIVVDGCISVVRAKDLIFLAVDAQGKIIDPPPSSGVNYDKINAIKVVDILLSVRSKKDFYRTIKKRIKKALNDDTRKIEKEDRYLRDTTIVSAHARNLGLQ